MSHHFYYADEHIITLGKKLGTGGEGSVYELLQHTDQVAKIYHKPLTPQKASKISGMVQMAHPRLLDVACWPQQILKSRKGHLVGFLMPNVQGYRAIHDLYGPASRKQLFPKADWTFLIHTARNLASAFATIHTLGITIGDINQGNVFVAPNATVKLIDCDSFQVQVNGRLHLCGVGIPQFTPPELQGLSFHDIQRTTNHDNFGLAILIFHLLFMGRHPFAGRYLGSGDMPIEKAIQEYRFAYGTAAASQQMRPPPHTIAFTSVSAEIMNLFERAFACTARSSVPRPTAQEWITQLDYLKNNLLRCPQNNLHTYHKSLTHCPWCLLEKSGIQAFITVRTPVIDSAFDLNKAWGNIIAIPSPGRVTPPDFHLHALPTPLPMRVYAARLGQGIKKVALVLFSLMFIISAPHLTVLVIALVVWIWSRSNKGDEEEKQQRTSALRLAEQLWSGAEMHWYQETGDRHFINKLNELCQKYAEYQNLNSDFQREQQSLEDRQREMQLQQFLSCYVISKSAIPGIGRILTARLQAQGIRTAADVNYQAVIAIPGFGNKRTMDLVLNWRSTIEAQFQYNGTTKVDPIELKSLQHRFMQKRRDLQNSLLAGATELKEIRSRTLQKREDLTYTLKNLAMQLAQARSDMTVF